MIFCVCDLGETSDLRVIPGDDLYRQNGKTLQYDVPCTGQWLKSTFHKTHDRETLRLKITESGRRNEYKAVRLYDIFDTQDEAEKFRLKLDDKNSGVRRIPKRTFHLTPSVAWSPKPRSQKKVSEPKKQAPKKYKDGSKFRSVGISERGPTAPKDAAKLRSENAIIAMQTSVLYDDDDSSMINDVRNDCNGNQSSPEKTTGIQETESPREKLTSYDWSESGSEKENDQQTEYQYQNRKSEESVLSSSHRLPFAPLLFNTKCGSYSRGGKRDHVPIETNTITDKCKTTTSCSPEPNLAIEPRDSTELPLPATVDNSNEDYLVTPVVSDYESSATKKSNESLTPIRQNSVNSKSTPRGAKRRFSVSNFIRKPSSGKKKSVSLQGLAKEVKRLTKQVAMMKNSVLQLCAQRDIVVNENLEDAQDNPLRGIPKLRKSDDLKFLDEETCEYKKLTFNVKSLQGAAKATSCTRRIACVIEARYPDVKERILYSLSGRGNAHKAVPDEEKTVLKEVCIALNEGEPLPYGDAKSVEKAFDSCLSNKLKADRVIVNSALKKQNGKNGQSCLPNSELLGDETPKASTSKEASNEGTVGQV